MRLIDADVLKQHIDKLPALPDGNFAGNHSALKALINMQPTIEDLTPTTHLIKYWAERKHGHGVEHIPHCKCANCDTDYLPRMAMAMNYCPNCGARFIKERDDRD